jgi:hypothetical protein
MANHRVKVSLSDQFPEAGVVTYCRLCGAQAGVDPEFGAEIKWDVPLLDGNLQKPSESVPLFGFQPIGIRTRL